MAVLIVFLLIILFLLIIQSIKKPKDYPPGPPWLPIIGCQHIIQKKIKSCGAMYLALQELAEEYETNVLGLKLGHNKMLCILGFENVREVFINNTFNGRPDTFWTRIRSFGARRGISFTDGPLWHEQRHFVVRHLRAIGFGKRIMEQKIINECQEIVQFIDDNGPDVEMKDFFAPNVLSVLWFLTAGKTLDRNDPKLQKLLMLLQRRHRLFDMSGGMLNHMPWLRFIAPEKTGYNLLVEFNSEIQNFFKEIISEHHETFTGDKSDLIYAYIKEMKEQPKENTTFTDDQLIMICLDLFLAGSQTTSSLLGFVFYNLLLYPEMKTKILQEIDNSIPGSTMIDLSDRLRLPYLEAFIMETRRMFPVSGIAGPRRLLNDHKMDNYPLKKDTVVLINIWSVHMDKKYWKDPEVFRPERFIGSDGRFYPNERILNFGIGKRRCPGEVLAKDCLFMFTSNVLQKFDISPVSNIPIPRNKAYSGLTMTPDPYSIHFVRR